MDANMTRVFIADTRPEERFALQLLLNDLKLEVVGEAADWESTLAQAPANQPEMLLVDWDLLPIRPATALEELRKLCPASMTIVLISRLDARQQAAVSSGADIFISKGEAADRITDCLRNVAADVRGQIAMSVTG
jgi:DNA-binding NarL/FixJ family response regulator